MISATSTTILWLPSLANKWAHLQEDLMALDADIQADNLQRNVPLYWSMLSEVETSVTVWQEVCSVC
jgi:hypothetical protein